MTLVAIELPGRRVSLYRDNRSYYIIELTDDADCDVRALYEIADYSSGLHVRNDYQIFEDLVAFSIAYVERPDEFERKPTDTEQENADWWRTFGEQVEVALA